MPKTQKTKEKTKSTKRQLPVLGDGPNETRFDKYGKDTLCGECQVSGGCVSQKWCEPARVDVDGLRRYSGIRLTSDGFDCALPVAVDSHSHCSFNCAYCFSENLSGHVDGRKHGLGQQSLRELDRILSGGGGKYGDIVRRALKRDRLNQHGFACPIQLGAINDPGDNYERQRGWLLEFIKLMIKHDQPVRISTKGTVLREPEYLRELAKAPHLFWVAFSIITPDDDLITKIDLKAPNATERLKTMKAVTDIGCKASLRFRPMMPGASDRTPNYPRAYQTLIERAADAGARAISYEVVFVPTRFNAQQRKIWDRMERLLRVPLKEVYSTMSKSQACLRVSHKWTENIMHSVHEVAKSNGMTVGVSDPNWKQLNDSGCCCAMLPDDPVFGNWERENATNVIVEGVRDPNRIFTKEDITPPWAKDLLQAAMCNMGAGPLKAYAKKHFTWADKLEDVWHDIVSERGPMTYFQGALEPVGLPDGQVGYRYKGLERHNKEHVPYWRILKPEPRDNPPAKGCNACGTGIACEAHEVEAYTGT